MLKIAIITGAHPFDVPGFQRLFQGHDRIEPYIQDWENFVHDWGKVRADYDALVFYHFHQATPDGAFAAAIEELGQRRQGIVVLHHALLAWPDWPLWSQVCGIDDRRFGYHPEQQVAVHVAAPHPITDGLADWTMTDETYTMADAGAGNEILLTADHPLSLRTLAWTRTHGAARVFCLQSGHDDRSWSHPSLRRCLARGIRWAAGEEA